MKKVIAWFGRTSNRGYLYRVVASGGVVAVFYGVLSAEEVAVWSGLVATGFALPAANTPTNKQAGG